MADDVACVALSIIFDECDLRGIPRERLLEGVTTPREKLEGSRGYIDWETFGRIGSNAEQIWTPEELVGIGRRALRQAPVRWIVALGRTLFSAKDFYFWLAAPDGPTAKHFPCIRT